MHKSAILNMLDDDNTSNKSALVTILVRHIEGIIDPAWYIADAVVYIVEG